jgi:hypothetical protein
LLAWDKARRAVRNGHRLRLRGGDNDLRTTRRRRRKLAAHGVDRTNLNQQRGDGDGRSESRRHRDQFAD